MISSAPIGSGVSPIEDAELIVVPLDQEGVTQQPQTEAVQLRHEGFGLALRTQEMRRT